MTFFVVDMEHFLLAMQVFDVTRKITYKNLQHWYSELRQHRPDIPCILVANKIDGKETILKPCRNFSGSCLRCPGHVCFSLARFIMNLRNGGMTQCIIYNSHINGS